MLLVSLTKCNSYVDKDCSSLQTTRDNLRTSENHCANYRVGVGLLGMKWMPKPDLNISISDQYCANYRVAVGLLVGQGWERKRPTLSKRYSPPYNAVGVGLFLLVGCGCNLAY